MSRPYAEINPKPQDVVFITSNAEAVWPATNPNNLAEFIDDCHFLGFAVWLTPSTVYVFTGEDE